MPRPRLICTWRSRTFCSSTSSVTQSSWSTSSTSCTVHYVDAGVDSGEIIAQREVPILPNDTPETLHARIQVTERELYPEVIRRLSLTTDRN
ncbi:MAG: hypothetical protein H0W20_08245 [Chthoniobacterales bacterium]|nr:hypothetical protein [Chthoniobacterales bacterium]